jgi:hypothetical protein
MQYVKKYGLVTTFVLIVLIAVLIRTFGSGHFRNDTKKWTEPSIRQSVYITHAMLNNLTGNTLMVDLSDQGDLLKEHDGAINIPAKSLFDKNYQKTLRAHKGNILLVSEDPAVSARMWMLLSQMGYSDLYILSDIADNEVLKYKFQPDTSSIR